MPANEFSTIGLFTPLTLGDLNLPNRIVMAPLTRNRAGEGNVPRPLNVQYYAQRALQQGDADMVAFGKLFIANPDLPERFAQGAALNEPDPDTFLWW